MVVLGTIANNMPELPEVETVVRTLKHLVNGKTIKDVNVLRAKNIDKDSLPLKESLVGKTINDITRIGKHIIFHFSDELVMISHLRMEGKYFLKQKGEPIEKHDIAIFTFSDDSFLAYNDTRKFGILKVSYERSYMSEKPISDVGPDPFMMSDSKRLQDSFKNKNIPIKQALLDQSVMSGLGNIYVDEVLFLTKLHPETPAKLVSKKQLDDVLTNAKIVLEKAIKAGGSTIKSYHPQQGISGEFQVQLQVYGKEGQKCPRCGTAFTKIFVGGRGSTFCPHCQKNIALPHVVAISGAISSGKSLAGKYFEEHGYHRFDADEIVHQMYQEKTIQEKMKKLIPELVISNGDIDRIFLKEYLLNNPSKKKQLEKMLYEIVYERAKKFIASFKHTDKVVLEVPMLFKAKMDELADEIYIIEVSKNIQKERLAKRNADYETYLKLNESYYLQEDKEKAVIIRNDADVTALYKKLDKIIYGK